MIRATLTAVNIDGLLVTIIPTKDEVSQIMERNTKAAKTAAARRIVSEAPTERILTMERM